MSEIQSCSSSHSYGSFIRFMYSNTPNIGYVMSLCTNWMWNTRRTIYTNWEFTRDLFEIIFFDWINFWLVKLGKCFSDLCNVSRSILVIATDADQYFSIYMMVIGGIIAFLYPTALQCKAVAFSLEMQ